MLHRQQAIHENSLLHGSLTQALHPHCSQNAAGDMARKGMSTRACNGAVVERRRMRLIWRVDSCERHRYGTAGFPCMQAHCTT